MSCEFENISYINGLLDDTIYSNYRDKGVTKIVECDNSKNLQLAFIGKAMKNSLLTKTLPAYWIVPVEIFNIDETGRLMR